MDAVPVVSWRYGYGCSASCSLGNDNGTKVSNKIHFFKVSVGVLRDWSRQVPSTHSCIMQELKQHEVASTQHIRICSSEKVRGGVRRNVVAGLLLIVCLGTGQTRIVLLVPLGIAALFACIFET